MPRDHDVPIITGSNICMGTPVLAGKKKKKKPCITAVFAIQIGRIHKYFFKKKDELEIIS